MAKKNERNLNITIKNHDEKDEVIISISSILKQMKRMFAIWIVAAIVAGLVVFALSAFRTFSSSVPAEAIVSFTYDGIEQGLDPKKAGTFDIETMKSPRVIEMALTEMGLDIENLEYIRSNISFGYIMPQEAYEKLKAYNSVMEKATSGSLSAAQAMLDVKYYPTKYEIFFNYGNAGFDKNTGTEILNTIVDCYGDYFYQLYGFNEPLGASVAAVDSDSYDYPQQIELYRDSLRKVRSYLDELAKEDNTAFRSSITGYSFNDLSEYAKTVTSIDLDRISSYISVNNVTKDKNSALAYYGYRIEQLTLDKDEYSERLAALDASIAKYVKDSATFIGAGAESINGNASIHSDQYDAMFRTKTTLEANLAQTVQDIKFYESRREALKTDKTSSKANIEKVEADLEGLKTKVTDIVDLTEKTADDYFKNVQFANAYSVLAYASKSATAGLSQALSASLKKIIVWELLIFAMYLAAAFFSALKRDNSRKKAVADAEDDYDDDDEEDLEDVIEAIEEAAEKEANSSKKPKKK